MQLTALVPLLTVLATAVVAHPTPDAARAAGLRAHERALDRVRTNIDGRNLVDPSKPRALTERPRRKVKRSCQDAATTVTTSSTEAAASYASTESASTESASVTDTSSWTAATTDASSTESYASATETSASADNNAVAAAVVTDSASTTASSSAVTTSSATNSASASTSTSSLTPNGKKAGIAGGDTYDFVSDYIGWWYDWTPAPSGHTGTPLAVPMLWGDGGLGSDDNDAARYAQFTAIPDTPVLPYIIAFEEPDCSTEGSSNIDSSTAATVWDSVLAPHGQAGSILLSPSMCHQADETWLTPFKEAISYPWDVTNVHINKNSMDGVNTDLDYYYNTYGKPIWVTEFACVDDNTGFVPCTDQDEINTFINDIVALFESDSRVYAYAYSNGEGLGDVWPMGTSDALSASGETYLAAIKQY